jgi:hypothetical protein
LRAKRPKEEVDMNSTELPRWKCHKEVHAFKIIKIELASPGVLIHGDGFFVDVSDEFMRKHRPQLGGFYVRYEDGYESFSPAKAFEEGYARI